MLTITEFQTAVWLQLPTEHLDERGRQSINQSIEQHYKNGFTVSEAGAHLRCCEEVDPELDEDVALARMARISAAVKARQASEQK